MKITVEVEVPVKSEFSFYDCCTGIIGILEKLRMQAVKTGDLDIVKDKYLVRDDSDVVVGWVKVRGK